MMYRMLFLMLECDISAHYGRQKTKYNEFRQ